MSNRILSVQHHVDDYECMWNGIEDLYMQKSGEKIPKQFFFSLSGKGNFIYLKSKTDELKRRVAWGDGRTKKMYKEIADIVGFTFKHIEGRTFEYTLKTAKEQIDAGCPVVLGCLDMYYLHYYPKFHEKMHIPIHYVLMVGYDDDKGIVYVLDCGINSVQEIPYDILKEALNVETKGLSLKNTICKIEFDQKPRSTIEIAKEGFYRKAVKMLESPVEFAGIRGMYKFAKEFPHWQEELTQEEYDAALLNLIMFSGTVPKLPNRLLGIVEDDFIHYMCCREHLVKVLTELGKEYQIPEWCDAAEFFMKSGVLLEKMTYQMANYLLKEQDNLNEIPDQIVQVAQLEEKAYKTILTSPISRKSVLS